MRPGPRNHLPQIRAARNWVPKGLDRSRLRGLRALEAERAKAQDAVYWQIELLRSNGVPWRAIAAELGVSTSAAQQRYRER